MTVGEGVGGVRPTRGVYLRTLMAAAPRPKPSRMVAMSETLRRKAVFWMKGGTTMVSPGKTGR